MSNSCGQQAVSKGKKNKAEQNLENPLLEELASENSITGDQIVMADVFLISLLVVLDVFTQPRNFLLPNQWSYWKITPSVFNTYPPTLL